jgi:sulfate transport system ATP-binding protein
MTVAKNIAFGLEIRKRPKDDVRRRVAELLNLVQLDGFGDRYPSQLSGGQRQRMALARALAVEPEVLLLDEPFGALDARVRSELRAWLRRLHDEMHVTTVFVTHDQEEAMEVSDTIVLMDHGRIVQEGRPQDLYDHPENEFVMRFMGQVNRIGDVYVRPHDVEIRLEPNGTTEPAVVERILHMGHHIRDELLDDGGEPVAAQLTRDEADRLRLEPGRPVFVRPSRAKTFTAGAAEAPPEPTHA